MLKIGKLNLNRLLLVGLVLGCVFLFAGGFSAVKSYTVGASSFEEYRAATTAPLFAGGLLMGTFGLMYTYKNRGSAICLVGMAVTIFSYFFIEYLFTAIGM